MLVAFNMFSMRDILKGKAPYMEEYKENVFKMIPNSHLRWCNRVAQVFRSVTDQSRYRFIHIPDSSRLILEAWMFASENTSRERWIFMGIFVSEFCKAKDPPEFYKRAELVALLVLLVLVDIR